MDTPILDFVRQYADSDMVRFHMPGHKGRNKLGCEQWDITEVKGADAITTVCEMEHSPLWSMTLDQSMSLSEYRNSMIENIPRQKLAQYYRINGAVYIRKVNYTSENVEILCNCEYAYVMDKDKSVDIDELIDFELAELLMRKRNNEEN